MIPPSRGARWIAPTYSCVRARRTGVDPAGRRDPQPPRGPRCPAAGGGRNPGMTETERALFLAVTIKPRKDRLEEAEAQLQSMRRNTLNEPGCVFMHLVQPQDDPDNWVMLEMFRSRAAWDEHMQQPYNVEGNKILEDLLREPSELRLMDGK